MSCLQSSEHLLTKVLTWAAQAMMGADMASTPDPQMLLLFGEPILDLLDDKLPVSQHVRSNVLHLIRLLVKSLRDGGTLAGAVRFLLMPDVFKHDQLLSRAPKQYLSCYQEHDLYRVSSMSTMHWTC